MRPYGEGEKAKKGGGSCIQPSDGGMKIKCLEDGGWKAGLGPMTHSPLQHLPIGYARMTAFAPGTGRGPEHWLLRRARPVGSSGISARPRLFPVLWASQSPTASSFRVPKPGTFGELSIGFCNRLLAVTVCRVLAPTQ
jgi:hypothetical protein